MVSLVVEKKWANPREKKLGKSPGAEKRFRGTWKWRSPTWIKISDLNNCCVKRGTKTACQLLGGNVEPLGWLTAVELGVSKQSDIMRPISWLDVVACTC
jgi:hypothetical protein